MEMDKSYIILICFAALLILIALWIALRKLMTRGKRKDVDSDNEANYELPSYHQQSHTEFTIERGITVTIRRGDITDEDVDVIVNAANGRLQHGGGVARAIAMKAGEEINVEGQRALRGRELKVSEVLHTGGYKLKAKYVVHAVGPIRGQDNPFSYLLKRTFFNCLDYADVSLEARSIAIPLISSGVFGGSKDECADALMRAVKEFSKDDSFKTVNEIRLINIDAEATRAINTTFSIGWKE